MDSMHVNDNFVLYPKRWWILAMFCAINMTNAMLWVTFAPISDVTQHYFGAVGTITAVNLLAIVFQIIYAPGTWLSIVSMKKYGMKSSMLIGGVLTVAGTAFRLLGTLTKSSIGDLGAYLLVFFGQFLASLAQPMYVNIPAYISSTWFSPSERDLSTTIGALFSPLGNALGTILPVIFVSETENQDGSYSITGMTDLMLAELIICVLPVVVVYFFFTSSPPSPPSQSTKLKSIQNKKKNVDAALDEEYHKIKKEIVELMNNKDYVLLLIAFSVGLGIFTTVMTLINQLVAIHDYSNDDAGLFGAVLIIGGLVGAGLAGHLMERTKAYRTILKGGFLACSFSMILLAFMLRKNNFNLVLLSFALLGFFILPMLPAVLENCAECTYPVSEEVSSGLLFVGGNVIGIGFIFALQVTIDSKPWYGYVLRPSNVLMIGLVVMSTIILLFYDGKYKRMECESLLHPLHTAGFETEENPLSSEVGCYDRPDVESLARVVDNDGSHDSLSYLVNHDD